MRTTKDQDLSGPFQILKKKNHKKQTPLEIAIENGHVL